MKRLSTLFLTCLLAFSLLGVSPWGSGGEWGSGKWGRSDYFPGFNPGDIVGLTLWLDSGYGVTYDESNRVTAWADRSGTVGNTTAAGAGCPLYSTTDVVNGRPALYFVTNDYMTIPQLFTDITEVTAFMVIKLDNTTTDCRPLGYDDDGGLLRLRFNYSVADRVYWYTYDGGYKSHCWPNAGVTNWHIWTITIKEDDNLRGYGDGVEAALSPTAVGTLAETGISTARRIGADGGGNYMPGYIAEVIIYSRLLSADERSKVDTYLSNKYGITI